MVRVNRRLLSGRGGYQAKASILMFGSAIFHKTLLYRKHYPVRVIDAGVCFGDIVKLLGVA